MEKRKPHGAHSCGGHASLVAHSLLAGLVAGCGGPIAPPAGSQPPPVIAVAPAGETAPAATDPASDPSPAQTPSGPVAAAEVRERTIVRKKLPKDLRSIALEYTVILLDDDDKPRPVDPASHTFAVGDSFLVRIRPQDDLFVYVFNEGPDGRRVCLLPSRDEEPQLVKAGAELNLPDDGGYFTFEPPAGEEKLVVVAAPEPIADLRLLAASAFGGAKPLATAGDTAKADPITAIRERSGDGVRSRGPIRKVVERIESQGVSGRLSHVEPPTGGEPSSYGIAISGPSDGSPELILDIPLRSQDAAATQAGE
jgi:hypothetical protein